MNYFVELAGPFAAGFEETNGLNHQTIMDSPLQRNQWYFIVATYDGSQLKLWIDGEEKKVLNTNALPETNNYPLVFGYNEYCGCDQYTGILDDVRIYDRALTGAEIQELYNVPPVANAGSDTVYELTAPNGAIVTLDGSESTDADSSPGTNDDIVSFQWYEGDAFLGSGEVISTMLPLGNHNVKLVVTDSKGATSEDYVLITVQDTTPTWSDTGGCVTLLDHNGNGLAGGKVQYACGGSWQPAFTETTGADGKLCFIV